MAAIRPFVTEVSTNAGNKHPTMIHLMLPRTTLPETITGSTRQIMKNSFKKQKITTVIVVYKQQECAGIALINGR
jgi:hypothetical protein